MASSGIPEVPVSPSTEARPGGGIDPWRRVAQRLEAFRRSPARSFGQSEPHAAIAIDRDDTLATVCGKLDSARVPRVALLLPNGNRDLSRPIGMRLLMRHAHLTGKEIVIVSTRQAIRRRAQAEGQTYVSDERRIGFESDQLTPLPLGGLNLGVPARALLLPALALTAMLVAAFCVVFWYLPVARITLYPPSESVTADQLVMVDEQATQLNTSGFIVPAQRRQTNARRTVFIRATGDPASDAPGSVHTVATADLDAGQALAVSALREQGLNDLRANYGAAETFFPESVQVQVSDVSPGQQAGDPADFLQVSYTGSVSALSAKNTDLRGLFTSLLQRNLRSDRQILEQSLVLTVLNTEAFDAADGRLPVHFRANADSTALIDTGAIAARLRGQNRNAALAAADADAASVQPATLTLSPRWVPWLPRVTGHIHLELQPGRSP
jgi:hypothetical protein